MWRQKIQLEGHCTDFDEKKMVTWAREDEG